MLILFGVTNGAQLKWVVESGFYLQKNSPLLFPLKHVCVLQKLPPTLALLPKVESFRLIEFGMLLQLVKND